MADNMPSKGSEGEVRCFPDFQCHRPGAHDHTQKIKKD